MADIRILRGQRIVPDIDQALHVAGYQKANLGRDKSLARCQELVPVLRPLMQAKAVLAFTDDKVYVILTLGEAVSRQLDRYEKDGDVMDSLLFNAWPIRASWHLKQTSFRSSSSSAGKRLRHYRPPRTGQ